MALLGGLLGGWVTSTRCAVVERGWVNIGSRAFKSCRRAIGSRAEGDGASCQQVIRLVLCAVALVRWLCTASLCALFFPTVPASCCLCASKQLCQVLTGVCHLSSLTNP